MSILVLKCKLKDHKDISYEFEPLISHLCALSVCDFITRLFKTKIKCKLLDTN